MTAAKSSRRLCWFRCDEGKCGSIGHGPAGASQFLSHRRAKHQASKPKLQRIPKSQKHQIPQNRCRGKRRAARFLSLELGASLELGVWNLELFAWALSFSKIETRPGRARLLPLIHSGPILLKNRLSL